MMVFMDRKFVAEASIIINVPRDIVWNSLVNPKVIKQYMFGTDVVSEWEEGSSIIWKGEWEGKKYEDKGVIIKLRPKKLIQYSHFSPLLGRPDKPENYHTVKIELTDRGNATFVSLSQDNNSTEETKAHSEQNWKMMLEILKKLLEKS